MREGEDILLMAWGIVHNPADEDVDDVELTLTTGQPVSFEIDLYHPKTVARRRVEEKSRAAAAPESFERAAMAPASFGAPPPPAPAPGMSSPGAPSAPAPRPQASMAAGMYGGMSEEAAKPADRGELFEYRVLSRVSLSRGGSAMVPLLSSRLPAKKQRIWRPGPSSNPNIVLAFTNDSGAVLEEGPAVLYDEEVYAGEAMVPYTTRGSEVKLAFARDLSLIVGTSHESILRVSGLRLADALLYEDLVRESSLTITIDSSHDEETEVVVELPKNGGRELHPDSTKPFEETANYRRFLVKAASRGLTKLVVTEWWREHRTFHYEKLTGVALSDWLGKGLLDVDRHAGLQEIVSLWAAADDFDRQAEASERRAADCYARQKRVGEQLGVLRADGPEGALRLKHVKELEIEQAEAARHEQEAKRQRSRAEELRAQGRGLLGKATAG